MKNTTRATNNRIFDFIVLFLIGIFIAYFGYLTILRYQTLYASYFDLGIMDQTVYNTYKAISTFDWGRFLELTNPYGPEQIKRMAIHNDILLAVLAPFYFIYSGPETLLVIQTFLTGAGGWALYLIAKKVFEKNKWKHIIGVTFVLAYLLNPALQKASLFDFHAVTLTTGLLLFAFYFWLTKKYVKSFIFIVLSLLAKEQVGLTTSFFGIFAFLSAQGKDKKARLFGTIVFFVSIIWFALSVSVITPFFRGGKHFALKYYSEYGDSPAKVIFGLILKPLTLLRTVFSSDTFTYIYQMLGPVAFLSLLSPVIFIAAPEFAINVLSKSDNMRNLYYHYTAVITPFVFISAIYGSRYLISYLQKVVSSRVCLFVIIALLLFPTFLFAYFNGPLPYAKEQQLHPFKYPAKEAEDVAYWASILRSDKWKISATGHLAPYFSSRRYFYAFNPWYEKADYIVLRKAEVFNYPEKNVLIPVYEKLTRDERYVRVYSAYDLEVFKRVLYN